MRKLATYLTIATAITFWVLIASAQTVEIVREKISPAEIYARLCQQDEALKPFTEPSPLPMNKNRVKINDPFKVSVR
jgi:hypothetical protein